MISSNMFAHFQRSLKANFKFIRTAYPEDPYFLVDIDESYSFRHNRFMGLRTPREATAQDSHPKI